MCSSERDYYHEGEWFDIADSTAAALRAQGERIRRLLRLPFNPVTLRRTGARIDGVAGAVLAANTLFQIAPKFLRTNDRTWVEGLNSYLNYVGRYRAGFVPAQTKRASLRNFVDSTANHFCHMLEIATRQGLPLSYSLRRCSGQSPTGKLDVTASLRNLASLKPVLEWDEAILSSDTAAARLIRLALQVLVRQCRDGNVLQRVETNLASWPTVPVVMPARKPVLSRAFAHFSPIVSLAYDICLGQGRTLGAKDAGYAYVVDMPRTFEKAVERALRDSAKLMENYRLSVVPQVSATYAIKLTSNSKDYSARPDAVVYDNSMPLMVVDAKYKTFEEGEEGISKIRPAHSDFYQVLTAAIAHRAALALIVYPTATGTPGITGVWRIQVSSHEEVTLAAGTIRVVGLSSGATPGETHSDMKGMLEHLLEFGETQR